MKKIVLLFFISIVLCSCSNKEVNEKEPSNVESKIISCSKKDELMQNEAVLIDVRTMQEYSEGHLDGSVNVSVESINTMIEKLVPDKKTSIIVYCRSGNRSATAARTLINLGYENVYDLGAMSNCSS